MLSPFSTKTLEMILAVNGDRSDALKVATEPVASSVNVLIEESVQGNTSPTLIDEFVPLLVTTIT